MLAVYHGLIIGAFKADKWLPATAENGTPTREGRWGFVGREAPKDIQKLYLNHRRPDEFSPKGTANPIRYVTARAGVSGPSTG